MKTNILKESFRGLQSICIPDEIFEKRVIFFSEKVTAESIEELIAQLLQLENSAPGEPITLMINSPGGEVHSGLAAVDIMEGISSPIRTVCMGYAASMGAILFLQGEERIMMPHSKLLIHDPSFSGGDLSGVKPLELQEQVDQLMQTRTEIAEIIAKRTGRNIDEIYEKTKKDYTFTAEEALEFGAATSIGCFTLDKASEMPNGKKN